MTEPLIRAITLFSPSPSIFIPYVPYLLPLFLISLHYHDPSLLHLSSHSILLQFLFRSFPSFSLSPYTCTSFISSFLPSSLPLLPKLILFPFSSIL